MSANKKVNRILNVGKTIDIKGVEVTVKEPSLSHMMTTVQNFIEVSSSINFEAISDNSSLIKELLGNEEVLAQVKKLANDCTDLSKDEIESLGMVDWMKLVVAFKEVVDFDEVKTLFFQILPQQTQEA
jgi:hypothetical protein